MATGENGNGKGEMSRVCAIAHTIYSTWKGGGKEKLKSYFMDELGIPEVEAELFSSKYKPENAPVNVCPLEAVKKRNSSSDIFSKLSLQFESGQEGVWPKNVLGWWIMKHAFGFDTFDFQIEAGACHQQGKNRILFPAMPSDHKGNSVSFGLAAIEAVDVAGVPAHVFRKTQMFAKDLGAELATDVARTFLGAGILFPPPKEISQLIGVLKRGMKGEEIILTGAFCPDYAYEETGDPDVPFRYTFDGVCGGIGLVAKQFQRVVPKMHELLDAHGIKHRIVLSIGDFEANSQKILDRVNLTRAEFMIKCQRSIDVFGATVSNVPMELSLFERDIANGRWLKYIAEAHQRMQSGDFGAIKKNTGKDPITEVVRFVAKSSREFYNAWYDKEHTLEELMNIVIAQGAEYAAMGRIIAEDFSGQPVIQLAGDRAKMQAFNGMYSSHPTLCTRRVY